MPEDLANFVVTALRVIDLIPSIFVDLNAAQPLTGEGTSLVHAIAHVATAWANFSAQLCLNNPL